MKTISKQELKDKLAQAEKELELLAESFKMYVSWNDRMILYMSKQIHRLEPLEIQISSYEEMLIEKTQEIAFLKENVDREKLYQAQYQPLPVY